MTRGSGIDADGPPNATTRSTVPLSSSSSFTVRSHHDYQEPADVDWSTDPTRVGPLHHRNDDAPGCRLRAHLGLAGAGHLCHCDPYDPDLFGASAGRPHLADESLFRGISPASNGVSLSLLHPGESAHARR